MNATRPEKWNRNLKLTHDVPNELIQKLREPQELGNKASQDTVLPRIEGSEVRLVDQLHETWLVAESDARSGRSTTLAAPSPFDCCDAGRSQAVRRRAASAPSRAIWCNENFISSGLLQPHRSAMRFSGAGCREPARRVHGCAKRLQELLRSSR